MQRCYAGESFELDFVISDPKDDRRTVDSGSYEVIGPDGGILQSGILAIDSDGHTATMRFEPEQIGMHRIIVSWRMGNDAWKQPHLIQVEDARA